ncbi:MAG TPA: nuclear transport factor 2 family protein [Stellaceae bacterium]|nr:nuclear transport factor 2 family protein [Stellaceae bacterium]
MVTLDLMKAISAAFNSRDVDRIVAFFAEDGVFCLSRGPEPVGRTLKGKAMIRQVLADRFKQIPDMRWENEEYILAGSEGDKSRAVSIWTVCGKGADGEELNYQGCDIYTFGADDKIVHKNTFWKIVESRTLY